MQAGNTLGRLNKSKYDYSALLNVSKAMRKASFIK